MDLMVAWKKNCRWDWLDACDWLGRFCETAYLITAERQHLSPTFFQHARVVEGEDTSVTAA
jgi:hypothetical protein